LSLLERHSDYVEGLEMMEVRNDLEELLDEARGESVSMDADDFLLIRCQCLVVSWRCQEAASGRLQVALIYFRLANLRAAREGRDSTGLRIPSNPLQNLVILGASYELGFGQRYRIIPGYRAC